MPTSSVKKSYRRIRCPTSFSMFKMMRYTMESKTQKRDGSVRFRTKYLTRLPCKMISTSILSIGHLLISLQLDLWDQSTFGQPKTIKSPSFAKSMRTMQSLQSAGHNVAITSQSALTRESLRFGTLNRQNLSGNCMDILAELALLPGTLQLSALEVVTALFSKET